MELVAVDVAAMEIGAAFMLVIVIAAAIFLLHNWLLQRAVQRYQASLRAQRPQANVAEPPVVADHQFIRRLRLTTAEEFWAKRRQAATNDSSKQQ